MNLRIPCAAGLAAIVLAVAPAFAADNKDVRVVNTPAERIPVEATGTVALAPGTQVEVVNPVILNPAFPVTLNPATAQVGVAGFVHLAPFTGPVFVAPGSEVNVANTAATPLHVVSAAPVPETFVSQANLEWIAPALGFGDFEVPAGRRLVIEYVGGSVVSDGETMVDFRIQPLTIGGGAEFLYPAQAREINAFTYAHRFSEAVHLYHDGSRGPLRIGAITFDGEVPAVGFVSVSGYLINTP
jgi:hypothetical protein